jgi:hypothetical protein
MLGLPFQSAKTIPEDDPTRVALLPNSCAASFVHVREFLTKSKMAIIPHLPYSPHLVP